MKKLIAIILCCLAFTGIAQARTNWRFYVGGMYAKGFDQIHNYRHEYNLVDMTKDYDMYTLWAGLDIQFFIKDKFIIETGLNYRMAPYAHFETDNYNTITINGKQYKQEWLHESTWGNFASIPLRFGYHLTLNNKNSFDFCVGPYAAISLGTPHRHSARKAFWLPRRRCRYLPEGCRECDTSCLVLLCTKKSTVE